MKRVGTKLAVALAGLLVVFAGLAMFRTWSVARAHTRELTARQAALALEFDLAIRKYVAEKVRPEMERRVGPDEFIPETMSSSFVARSIFEQVRERFPGAVLKFSSDNPRNPANQAGPEELKIIRYFNENPRAEQWSGEVHMNGGSYYAHFHARRMTKQCLGCHGKPADAPASLVARYGNERGFDRPVGDVIAMDTVAIPMDDVNAALAAEATTQSLVMLAGVGVLFGIMFLAVRLVVTRRLVAITRHFRQSAREENVQNIRPVEIGGADEVADLAASHNVLVAKLRDLHESMEQTIAERTAELAETNVQLQGRAAELEASRKTALSMMDEAQQARQRAEALQADAEESEQQLREATGELRRFNGLAMGRESRIIELKEEVNRLCEQLGRPAEYPSVEGETSEGVEAPYAPHEAAAQT